MIQVDILGSTVSRDVFRYAENRGYKVNRCIGNIPISSIYTSSLNLKTEIIDAMQISEYSNKMLKLQMKGNAVDILKKSKVKILVIDLIDECMNRYSFGDGKRGSVAIKEDDEQTFEEIVCNYTTDNKCFNKFTLNDLDENVVEECYKEFAKQIVYTEENPSGYLEKNIIVLEAYYTTSELSNKSLALKKHDSKYKIKEKNSILEKVYKILYQCIPDCKIIRFPDHTFSTENNIRGSHPLSYTTEIYEYYVQCLDVLTRKSKRNSLDNLYLEQSLENRMKKRVLNASAIYKIKPLEKEVEFLKKEIERLKKMMKK